MSDIVRDLVVLILNFLDEKNFKEAKHVLERESGFFFDMKYFEEKTLAGEWEEVERYLSGFTTVDGSRFSTKIFFDIRKQKYLEALDRNDLWNAIKILREELQVICTSNAEAYKELSQLLTLENFRQNKVFLAYGNTESSRHIMLVELKKLIEADPHFQDKLVFPPVIPSRLHALIGQSFAWQHDKCKTPRPAPEFQTLCIDHNCAPPNVAHASPASFPFATVPNTAATYAPCISFGPFAPPVAASNAKLLAGLTANASTSSTVQSAVIAAPSIHVQSNQVPILKQRSSSSNYIRRVKYQNAEPGQLNSRLGAGAYPVSEFKIPAPVPQVTSWSSDDLPRVLVCNLFQGSLVTSMDFHPSHHTLLLGSAIGEVTLWEIRFRVKVVSKPFKLWEMTAYTPQFQRAIMKDSSISTNRVTWSPDGRMIGVAFSKHLIHLHAYRSPNHFGQLLEIDAHVGGVNDIAFSHPYKELCLVTCGDDMLIKVWNLKGERLLILEGHEAHVYSICPCDKPDNQFIFSTSVDGKIKVWLYDSMGSRIDSDAPGGWCTTMLYSKDGSRLFSCGTSKDGECFLIEWKTSEVAIKRKYSGFTKKSNVPVHFDTSQNRFLAVGEDHEIKFWEADYKKMIAITDAEGGLPDRPCLRFNKEGNLLAVTTADYGFKILANADGLRIHQSFWGRSFEEFRAQNEAGPSKVSGSPAVASISANISTVDRVDRNSPAKLHFVLDGGDSTPRITYAEPRISEELSDKPKFCNLADIVTKQQCRVVAMPDKPDPASKVARLLYTHSGVGLLALGSNGIQRLWKWNRNKQNPSGKATSNVVPEHWQPDTGLLMTNDVSDVNLEEAIPCFALSKNDTYLVSSCGGKISIFHMTTFEAMITFMPPPPASTFLSFNPQDNNIIAVGMEDSTIRIYDVRRDEVKLELKGHQKRISCLAFSSNLRILVSSGADAQLCIWDIETWEKRKSIALQVPAGKTPSGDTQVYFNSDQNRLLVVHETQLVIYDASKAECMHRWVPCDTLSAPLSCASYSCNSQLVYASFSDGYIGVFKGENLRLECRISPSAYMPNAAACSNPAPYPLVIVTHPKKPDQFAVGLSDGAIKVIEPLESDVKWDSSRTCQ